MVRVCLGFTDINNLVASHIRAERAAEKLDAYQSRQGPGGLLEAGWSTPERGRGVMAGSGPGEGGDPARRGRPAGALRDVNPLTRKGAALFSAQG